jgi:hypothetical protein
VLENDGKDQLDRLHEKRKSITKSKRERNILHTVNGRKVIWIGHILRINFLLKHVIEGNIEEMGRRGRTRK